MSSRWSRRAILRGTAALGAAAALPREGLAQALDVAPYRNIYPNQAATLESLVSRLIPADATGPGALEAGAARYIDRALGEALAAQRAAYQAGLAAVDAYSRATHGNAFAALAPEAQDAVLTAMEENRATGFAPSSAAFFELVLGHTLEGTFGDPHYGGNQGYVGWELIGYPGLRLAVTAEDQRMNAALEPDYQSAYDHAMFDEHATNGERHDDEA
jgi:gluconate 2-dehydrogenase gamma chain